MSSSSMPEAIADSVFVCDCDESMHSACSGEPFYKEHGGKRYCVLHYPSKEKGEVFQEALQRKLHNQDLNFQGIWFPNELSFENFTFRVDAYFTDAQFMARSSFHKAKFNAHAHFMGARFGANAYFTGTHFGNHADFSKVQFDAEADFGNAGFDGYSSFQGVRFVAEASFRNATFSVDTYFNNAQFGANADFDLAQFTNRASFSKVQFGAGADFSYVRFHESTDITEAQFRGRVNFTMAEFRADAYFTNTQFLNYAYFYNARFTNTYFNDVIFNANVDFKDTWFTVKSKNINSPDVYFHRARFKDGVGFEKIYAEGALLSFTDAVFEKPERVIFHTVSLRPYWFINIDPRKFNFVSVDWGVLSRRDAIGAEIGALELKRRGHLRGLLEVTFHQLAVNAEENNRYEEAANFRYMAMEVRRLQRGRQIDPFRLSWWYWLLSGYGERVQRAFSVLITIWLFFAFIYWMGDATWWQPKQFNKPAAEISEWEKQPNVASSLTLSDALIYSAGTMTLQKPEPLPANKRAKVLTLFETILGPLQAALLALAIRRKFMR